MVYKTEQENFWSGDFGDEYIARNQGDAEISSSTAMFSNVLRTSTPISSVIEFGANIGINLKAIQRLFPEVDMSAVEINEKAVEQLRKIEGLEVKFSSILEFIPTEEKDLVLIKGVLIHINPDELNRAYEVLYKSSGKYICIAEYYNPSPVEVGYRGHEGRLFKRDFAGEIMDIYPNLELVDYGFVYHRDRNFPQDDITWFLLEKK
ncbi:pseudaminic acid biosynthesis-associated methylase [Solemya pervernicosa gill symbiont]|uniref:Pseudaminic acid biosynthesis-associated methylase n=1 Tax=Solemya pervernicosa gill symbiont TaxID=642797 RepID=A0A1T2KZH8_9GAMM|nr:pseudaminic acid biosynthesis-associated methylase [Solemya pervernicosa gill symbiont]OOZ38204.1 pseudaminic acid biosynthesis-associated methylase [Solemya pervernicosa gill symbiont]